WATSFLRPDVAAELLRDPHAIMVGSFGSPFGGRAVAVDGGYRVTGRWPFASGSPHATWLVGHSAVIDGDQPRLGPTGAPLTRVAISASFDNAMKAIDLIYTAGGGASVYRRNSLQRHFRDIHTVSQHSIVAPVSYEQIGQWLLSVSAGVEPTGRPLI